MQNGRDDVVIDALGMYHFSNPDAVSFVLSQIRSMAMVVPAFARNVGTRRKESNTFVDMQQQRKNLLNVGFLCIGMERT
jgi:hypothetical protein